MISYVFASVLVLSVTAYDLNTTSTNNLCDEYAACIEKSQQRYTDCHEDLKMQKIENKLDSAECSAIKSIRNEVFQLLHQKSADLSQCVRDKASIAEELKGRKANKCALVAKKLAKRSSLEPIKPKRKEKKDKKDKGTKVCEKEARRMRAHCLKIAKCCSIAKGCHRQSVESTELSEKKKELKVAVRECHKQTRVKKIQNKQRKQKTHEKKGDRKTKERKQDKKLRVQKKEE